MLHIETFDEKVPVTKGVITAVTKYEDFGMLIRDYVGGKPLKESVGIYVCNVDFDDPILTYKYVNNTAYVEKSIKDKFDSVRNNAEIFKRCGGNLDEFLKAKGLG